MLFFILLYRFSGLLLSYFATENWEVVSKQFPGSRSQSNYVMVDCRFEEVEKTTVRFEK